MTAPRALFVYGTLRHLPLLEVVLGRMPDVRPARLADHAVRAVAGALYPMIRQERCASAEGLLLCGLGADAVARLDFYEAPYGYELAPVTVETAEGPETAEVYLPTGAQPDPAGPWSLEGWVAAIGPASVAAAHEVMAMMGRMSAEEVKARYPQMLMRGASEVRAAAEPAPARVRSDIPAGAVKVLEARRPYSEFFALAEYDIRHPLHEGGMSAPVRRAAFVAGDAVTVLPWDPVRERVLLVEQFRFGAYMRGDPRPWSLEPVAGRIDPVEDPETAGRREAKEEAGLDLGAMHLVGKYYPSPGAVTEWLVSYVAIADLPDTAARVAGLDGEHEDILSHLVSFDDLMGLVESGEAANGPLILSAQWLAINRGKLA